jgi:hypothetical protein
MDASISVQDALGNPTFDHTLPKRNDIRFNHPDPFGGDLLQ